MSEETSQTLTAILQQLDRSTAYIVYDGECSLCSRYVSMVRLARAVSTVELVNGRGHHPAIDAVASANITIDDDMALIWDWHIYAGGKAMWKISQLSSGGSFLYRVLSFLLSSHVIARLLYPFLRLGRSMLLAVQGKRRITTSQDKPPCNSSDRK